MKKIKKRYVIILLLMISVIIAGYWLYQNYNNQPVTSLEQQEIALPYNNVKMYRNVKYSNIEMSQMDILMPKKIKKGDKLPLIIWTHGGGFIAGDKHHKNPYLAQIAEKGFIVANMNYALAPNQKYPTPIKQQVLASQFLKKNKLNLPIDFKQVVIGGDSAGAQLASQFAAIQTNEDLRSQMKLPQSFKPSEIRAVVLFGGLFNMNTVRATKFPRIELFMSSYTGEKQWEKRFKPIRQMNTTEQITKDYPPTFLTVGDADPFVSQNKEMVHSLKEKNIPVMTSFFDGSHHLKHQYQFHLDLPESKLTFKKVMMFLGHYTNQSPYNHQGKEENVESVVFKKKK